MQYEFTTDKVGSIKINNFHHNPGQTLKLEGIDAQITDADVILSGVNQFLSIFGFENEYEPTDVVRTVNQNVVNQQ